jgi:hypothetical protein
MNPEYVAGFFDGDGHRSKNGCICFTQRESAILREIQAEYGGHLRKINGGRHYRLQLRMRESRRFEAVVGPYSRKLRLHRRHEIQSA